MCRCQLQLPNFLKPGTDAARNRTPGTYMSEHLTIPHRPSSGDSSLLGPVGFGFCGGQAAIPGG